MSAKERLGAIYWEDRYQMNKIGWDMGAVSSPLKAYIDQLPQKDLRILIPGGGNAYEAEYLHHLGFDNVTVVDLAASPLKNLQQRCPTFLAEHVIQEDFFAHAGQYDLILEQTFFCAINPNMRSSYVDKMGELLLPGGKLVGVLFNIPLNADKPPHGGHEQEYQPLFSKRFDFNTWAPCINSHPARQGSEWWMNMKRKQD